MQTTVRDLAVTLLVAAAVNASAQGSGGGRGAGTGAGRGVGTAATTHWVAFGAGGVTLDCVQCTIHIGAGPTWVEFGAEPIVRTTTTEGGSLRAGDVLVAIDGILITAPTGGRRLADLPAGKPSQFTIRRDGRQMDVAITPTGGSGGLARGGYLGLTEPITWRRIETTPDSANPLRFRINFKNDSGKHLVILPRRDSAAPFRRDSSGRLTWQFGFNDKPVYTPTTPDGRPIGAGAGRGRGVGSATGGDTIRTHLSGNITFGPDSNLIHVRGFTNFTINPGWQLMSSLARTRAGANGSNGWLGFGIECHACSIRMDSAGTARSWILGTFPTVMGVTAGGPADVAGMRTGDVLQAIDGVSITTAAGAARFSKLKVGDRVRFTVERGGKPVELTLVVGKVN